VAHKLRIAHLHLQYRILLLLKKKLPSTCWCLPISTGSQPYFTLTPFHPRQTTSPAPDNKKKEGEGVLVAPKTPVEEELANI